MTLDDGLTIEEYRHRLQIATVSLSRSTHETMLAVSQRIDIIESPDFNNYPEVVITPQPQKVLLLDELMVPTELQK